MNEQQHSDEWTGDSVANQFKINAWDICDKIAGAHNAALKAEREISKEWLDKWGEILQEVVRLLGSIFLGNGKSLLGGSPPPMWTPNLIAQVAYENIKRNEAEVRKPLVNVLKGIRIALEMSGGFERTIKNIDAALATIKDL